MRAQGFTLIELLVVIAIISIITGITLAALGGTRAKANDARRVSELRSMLSTLIKADLDTATAGSLSCASGSAANTCPLLASFKDPSGASNPCSLFGPKPCQYIILGSSGNPPSTSSFQVCAYLENTSGGLPQGLIYINSIVYALRQGCPGF